MFALMHVYVLEHVVSLSYRTDRWILMKLGRHVVLMVPHLCLNFSANSAQGWIKGGAKRSMRGPFSKELLFQIGRLQQQTECIAVI